MVAPDCYEVLQLHPAAPLDLLTVAYWRLAGQAQAARAWDGSAAIALHRLTRCYHTLADIGSRAAYDRAIGVEPQSLVPSVPRRRPSVIRRVLGLRSFNHAGDLAVDYYQALRVHPAAESSIVAEAYAVMRNYYLRLVRLGREPPELLDLLEEAYAIISEPARRKEYDSQRRKQGKPTAVTKAAPVVKAKTHLSPARSQRKRRKGRQQGAPQSQVQKASGIARRAVKGAAGFLSATAWLLHAAGKIVWKGLGTAATMARAHAPACKSALLRGGRRTFAAVRALSSRVKRLAATRPSTKYPEATAQEEAFLARLASASKPTSSPPDAGEQLQGTNPGSFEAGQGTRP